MDNFKKLTYLISILAIYLTLKILIFTIGDKTLVLFGYYISIGSIFIPFWFFIGDILTELYGFNFTKRVLIIALVCQFIFAFACFSTTLIPSNGNDIDKAYNMVFGLMPRLAFSSLLALVFGALINAYLLDTWKKIVNGKYFLIRSLSTTLFSEVIFSFIAIYSQFMGKTSFIHVIQMLGASISIKLIVSTVIAYPVSVIANIIRYKADFDIIETKPPHPQQLID
jgi:uncharacterized integral membrane protein (TIGR00697 family)